MPFGIVNCFFPCFQFDSNDIPRGVVIFGVREDNVNVIVGGVAEVGLGTENPLLGWKISVKGFVSV